jgi:hypothetical protein
MRAPLAALVTLALAPGLALAAPPFDPRTQCLDGGMPYPVGTHLCTSTHVVEICLRPDQGYGVNGIFTVRPPRASGFDRAHWVSTTSGRCGPGDHGKVYRSTDPRR